jgi:hypothetical protein
VESKDGRNGAASCATQQAIDKDSTVLAGRIDRHYRVYGVYEVLSNKSHTPAKEAAIRALGIDDVAEAHASLAYAKGYD